MNNVAYHRKVTNERRDEKMKINEKIHQWIQKKKNEYQNLAMRTANSDQSKDLILNEIVEDEYQKLIDAYGEQKVKRIGEALDNYKGTNGKRYKSDYRATLNWVIDKVEKEMKNESKLKEQGKFKSEYKVGKEGTD